MTWADSQVAALVDAGVSLPDAQATVNFVLASVPDAADLGDWIPAAERNLRLRSRPDSRERLI